MRLSKDVSSGGGVKAIPNWEIMRNVKDPKPGELTMSRVNLRESVGEARTRVRSNGLR